MANEQIQRALDSAQFHIRDAHNGLAGTRVLQALVAVLAKAFLDETQQQQVETILDLHEECLVRDPRRGA
jgi:hypothetical protein